MHEHGSQAWSTILKLLKLAYNLQRNEKYKKIEGFVTEFDKEKINPKKENLRVHGALRRFRWRFHASQS